MVKKPLLGLFQSPHSLPKRRRKTSRNGRSWVEREGSSKMRDLSSQKPQKTMTLTVRLPRVRLRLVMLKKTYIISSTHMNGYEKFEMMKVFERILNEKKRLNQKEYCVLQPLCHLPPKKMLTPPPKTRPLTLSPTKRNPLERFPHLLEKRARISGDILSLSLCLNFQLTKALPQ